jgi:hypothetical protein
LSRLVQVREIPRSGGMAQVGNSEMRMKLSFVAFESNFCAFVFNGLVETQTRRPGFMRNPNP